MTPAVPSDAQSISRLVAVTRPLFEQQWAALRMDASPKVERLRDYGFKRLKTRWTFRAPSGDFLSMTPAGILRRSPEGTLVVDRAFHVSLSSIRTTPPLHFAALEADDWREAPPALALTLPALLAWFGEYEQWVLNRFGAEARRGLQPRVMAPSRVPGAWLAIASRWKRLLAV